jgi:cyclopropane fatty-acyl-phospholipid synthase-like methyltransferase
MIIICICIFICMFHYYQQNKNKKYDLLVKCIHCVCKTMYMNYGLWDNTNNLEQANKNLCSFIFNKANLSNNLSILDIGCGYGEQDFLLHSLSPSSTITALDL